MTEDERTAGQRLVDGRDRVLSTLEDLRASGQVSAELMDEYRTAIAELPTVVALSEWLKSVKTLDRLFCRYPDCFEPPEPPKAGSTGRPPHYCSNSRHNYTGRQAYLRSAERRGDASTGASAQTTSEAALSARPVSTARATIPERADRIIAAFGEVSRQIDGLRQDVRTLGDDEAREAEIDTERIESARKVEEADSRRLAAEQAMREMRVRMNTAEADRDEANHEASQAFDREQAMREQRDLALTHTASAVAAVREVQSTAREVRSAAASVVEQAFAHAYDLVEQARGRLVAEAEQVTRTAAAAIEHAHGERDQIRHEARQAVEQAGRLVAEADQKAASAVEARESMRQQLDTAHDQISTLQAQAVTRAEEHTANLENLRAELTTQHETIENELRTTVERLESAALTAEADRRTELDNLHREFSVKLAEAHAAAEAERKRQEERHEAEIASRLAAQHDALQQAIDAAVSRAERAERQLDDQARSRDTGRP